MIDYLHKEILSIKTTLKHFECKLREHMWEVGHEFEYTYLWMKHDHQMYALFFLCIFDHDISCILDTLIWCYDLCVHLF